MEAPPHVEKPDLYVVARFVDVLYRNGPMKKTNLQMATGLNYSTFTKYLEWFALHRLAEISDAADDRQRVALTAKGMDCHQRLVSWIRETMASLKL